MLHGSYSAIMQDEDGQILEAHSISAGLDYPGSGPEHAWLRDQGRATYLAVTDEQALDAFARVARLEGIIPALESSHALAWTLANRDSELDLVCLSGRGDKDLAEALRKLASCRARAAEGRRDERDGQRHRADRRGVRVGARGRAPRGADALPDGRLPRPRPLARDRARLRRGRGAT